MHDGLMNLSDRGTAAAWGRRHQS